MSDNTWILEPEKIDRRLRSNHLNNLMEEPSIYAAPSEVTPSNIGGLGQSTYV